MQMTACVLVGVGAVRLLVELLAVLENVGAVFRGLSTGDIAMERGEASVKLSVAYSFTADNVNMGVKCLTLVSLFITHAPVENTGQVKNSGLYTGVVKAVLRRIIDGDKPFSRTRSSHVRPHKLLMFLTKIHRFTEVAGG